VLLNKDFMKKNKTNDKYKEEDSFVYDEKVSKAGLFIKQDCELYHDEDNIPGSIVHVKRHCSKTSKEESWKVFVNNEEFLIIKGSRFTEKEREFLRGTDGMMFMINGAKSGWNSVSEFKRQLKEKI